MIIHFDDTELEVLVDDNSYRRRAVKEKDKLVLYYSLTHHVEIPVGAWVEYEGQVYSLFKASNFTKELYSEFFIHPDPRIRLGRSREVQG